jgi:S1-C subfamily serine protease
MHVYKLATIKSLDVAGTSFSDIPTVLWAKQKDVGADGNIGLPILRRFRLLVDLPHNRVLFAPPIDTATPFDANHPGWTRAPDPAGEKVLYAAPGSPAETAGLKADDLIITIDGMKVQGWQAQAGLSSWIYGAPGRRVHLGLLVGAARSLTFEKYF